MKVPISVDLLNNEGRLICVMKFDVAKRIDTGRVLTLNCGSQEDFPIIRTGNITQARVQLLPIVTWMNVAQGEGIDNVVCLSKTFVAEGDVICFPQLNFELKGSKRRQYINAERELKNGKG